MIIVIVIPSDKERRQVFRRMLAKIRAMTPAERIKTMVRAGIYTRGGKLTARYGGPSIRKTQRRKQ